MSTITDLDAFAPEPKRVQLGGTVYLLPADPPIPQILRLEQLGQQAAELSDEDAVKLLYAEILGLFQVHQPDLEGVPLSAAQLVNLIPAVYGGADPPPKPKPAGGTKAKTPQARRTKSRS